MDDFLNDPTLVDPDASEDIKYLWDEEFQRHVIALLISDRQFLLSSIDLVKPSYFTNKAHQKACSVAFKFFQKYRILPRKEFLVQEIKSSLKDDKALAYYLAEINVLYDYFQPGLDAREYLQDKITFFAKIQAVKSAFHTSLKEIDKAPEEEETWSKIYELMREAMTTNQNFDLGIDYFQTIKDRYAKGEEEKDQERFKTGIDGIDDKITGGGYIRGEIISVIAGSGVGKSVMLACITSTNLLRGKKGLYITLELAECKVAERFDAILTGFPIQCLHDHKEEIFDKLDSLEGIHREEKMGSLVIKQFAAGQASVNTIRAYISQLAFHGFDPDFIIVDYVGEMYNDPSMKTYESREKIVRDLRGMATEEDLFVATAMQPNRDSKNESKNERSRIDDQHLADSFGQIRPLDGCFSLNQNDTEKKLGMGRCYIIKQRDGESRYQVWLRFDKESLRITEISQETYKKAMVVHKELANDETTMDEIKEVSGVVGTWGEFESDGEEKKES